MGVQMTLYRECCFPNGKRSWWKSYFCKFGGAIAPPGSAPVSKAG